MNIDVRWEVRVSEALLQTQLNIDVRWEVRVSEALLQTQ